MSLQFTLTIELGNAEMRTNGDIAQALRKLATLFDGDAYGLVEADDNGSVRDGNGNTVGVWEIG